MYVFHLHQLLGESHLGEAGNKKCEDFSLVQVVLSVIGFIVSANSDLWSVPAREGDL